MDGRKVISNIGAVVLLVVFLYPVIYAHAEDILINGDFDYGPGIGWAEISDYPIIVDNSELPYYIEPHTSDFAAWLGGITNDLSTLYQDVAVPVGTNIQLKMMLLITTEETSLAAYDTLTVSLRTTSGTLLETIGMWIKFTMDTAHRICERVIFRPDYPFGIQVK
jgi:hypothetical protein